MSKQSIRYEFDDFDARGALKPSLTLLLAMLFLSRHVVIVILAGISTLILKRRGIDTGGIIELLSSPEFLLVSLPSVLLLIALMRRIPTASKSVRWIWCHGLWLLLIGAGMDITGMAHGLIVLTPQGAGATGALYIIGVVLDVFIVLYLFRSRRVADTFSDFPSTPDESAEKRKPFFQEIRESQRNVDD